MIHVVVGILRHREKVLTAWRGRDRHAGCCWEFPGGKLKPGESPEAALQRELREEIGIDAVPRAPIISLRYSYVDRRVLLNAREVERVSGEIRAQENQFLCWRSAASLVPGDFPAANRALITALKLPHCYAVTPYAENASRAASFASLRGILAGGIRLLVFRAPQSCRYFDEARQLAAMARDAGAQLMLHDHHKAVEALDAAGVHLSQAAAARIKKRPVAENRWFAVSCHNPDELRRAQDLGADFCVLGPVLETPSHGSGDGGSAPLGWDAFESIVAEANVPVFALGGMNVTDLQEARARGAQGIAGIRCFSSGT